MNREIRKRETERSEKSITSVDRRTVLKAGGVGAATALAGCSATGGGSKKVTIGYLGPMQADIGKGGYRGTQVAVDEINKNGGINGNDVELVKGDTQFKPSQANTLVNQFVNKNSVDMIMGIFVSEVALGVEDRLANEGVPFLGTGAASPQITQGHLGKNYDKYKNIFRVSPVNSDFQAKALADYGKYLNQQHDWSKFAVVVEDAAWTKPISNLTPPQLKDNGLDVTMNMRFAPDTNDFTPILDKVKSSGADVMLKAIAHVPGTGLLSTWRQNKYPFAQEGINVSSMSPAYWKDTNGGCQFETTSGPAGIAEVTDKSKDLYNAYTKKYTDRPSLPMYMGVGSYDAVHVYKAAVEDAGTTDYKNHGDEIVSSLEGTSLDGAGGHIEFFGKDAKYPHDVKYGVDKEPFVVDQWQKASDGNGLAGTNGMKVPVWPEKFAKGKHVAPSWMK